MKAFSIFSHTISLALPALFLGWGALSADAQESVKYLEGDISPNWTVPDRLNNDNGISMYDYAGKILFLDFYAHY